MANTERIFAILDFLKDDPKSRREEIENALEIKIGIGNDSNYIGNLSERNVRDSIQELDKLVYLVLRNKARSEDDHLGRDLTVILLDGSVVDIQVKSSDERAKQYINDSGGIERCYRKNLLVINGSQQKYDIQDNFINGLFYIDEAKKNKA